MDNQPTYDLRGSFEKESRKSWQELSDFANPKTYATADYVRWLENKVLSHAHDPTSSGWISVLDQEPNTLATILVIDKDGRMYVGGYYAENDKVCIQDKHLRITCFDFYEDFTHWMELPPSPPKDKKGE